MKHMKLPTQYVQEASAQFDLLLTLMARVSIYSGSTNAMLKALIEHSKRESDLDHEEQFLGAVIEYLDASERYYSDPPICEWCTRPTHQGKGWCCDDAAHYSQPKVHKVEVMVVEGGVTQGRLDDQPMNVRIPCQNMITPTKE